MVEQYACNLLTWQYYQQEPEESAPTPTLAEHAFPARANPMAHAASSAANADVSPPSVLLRHPDRGTGALLWLGAHQSLTKVYILLEC